MIHICLIRAHRGQRRRQRRIGRVEILFGSGILLHQRFQPVDILMRLQQRSLRHGQIGLRLQQCDLFLRELHVRFGLLHIA